jgi:hypothetical protein
MVAAAYRDVVHTNSALDIATTKASENYQRGLDSLRGVNGSLGLLEIYLKQKLKRFWKPDKYRDEYPLGLPGDPVPSDAKQATSEKAELNKS